MDGFTGFGERSIDFFDGIIADNSKAYWTDNRDVYESDVRAPMLALLAELSDEFADMGRAKVFRPYRDVRFAKDKSPYKTHCGGVIERARGAGACYLQVGADGLRVGGGSFHMWPAQLGRYRVAVAEDRRGESLAKILDRLTGDGWEVRGEQLRTAPRGFTVDHPRIDLLRRKAVYAMVQWEPDDALHDRRTLDRVRAAWRVLRPLNEWVADHVGQPADRRVSG
ncbi:MAG TPA: DUF2461 domain-containing protein [Pseudonocardiaceae bacterium]|nr:DUF2461 domain-containing protein [Pseudonocardiaceae bacterium]